MMVTIMLKMRTVTLMLLVVRVVQQMLRNTYNPKNKQYNKPLPF